MSVGTQDAAALADRLPMCGFSSRDHPVATADGIEIVVPVVKVGTTVTLHLIVSENDFPEPVELSTWYAIDLEHNAVATQRPDGALVGRHLGRSEDPPERRLTERGEA